VTSCALVKWATTYQPGFWNTLHTPHWRTNDQQQPNISETKSSTNLDRTEVTANIPTYHPQIIMEATKITKHPHNKQ
jgi:hypothetical protein